MKDLRERTYKFVVLFLTFNLLLFTCLYAVGPLTSGGALGKPAANLASSYEEPPSSLDVGHDVAVAYCVNSSYKLRSGERCHPDSIDQFVFVVPQNAEKVCHVVVQIVVGLHRGRRAVQKHGS